MSRQDKATTEKFTRALRELVKRPENKVCADCKRNDPRWASWNIGVFLCIRCSGIHRGMGTHISKVKSVDLDVWTPEQMESIQKWGNRLANLYWEAHLKAGHVPPEHKLESFVRSKYESKRWALEGPPPIDPSTLDNSSAASTTSTSSQHQPLPQSSTGLPSTSKPTHTPGNSISGRATTTARQPQAHQLLSANYPNNLHRQTTTQAAALPSVTQESMQKPAGPEDDIFSLDFHAPPVTSVGGPMNGSTVPKKDVKQDILSLYSPSTATAPYVLGQGGPPSSQAQPQPTSMLGNSGPGMWGASSGWTAASAAPVAPLAQSNPWGSSAAGTLGFSEQQTHFNSNDIWGSSNSITAPNQNSSSAAPGGISASQKIDDVFGDLWGGFK